MDSFGLKPTVFPAESMEVMPAMIGHAMNASKPAPSPVPPIAQRSSLQLHEIETTLENYTAAMLWAGKYIIWMLSP